MAATREVVWIRAKQSESCGKAEPQKETKSKGKFRAVFSSASRATLF
jgi:hypothetical protein